MLVKAILYAAVSYAASELLSSSKKPDPEGRSGIRANTRSTNEPLKVIYGRARVGGNDVYVLPKGAGAYHLYVVMTVAEGECDGVDAVYLGDKLIEDFGSDAGYTFYGGSASQTYDTDLETASENQWQENMRNTCYMIYHLKYNENKFSSVPERTVVLRGRKLYDFRDASTAFSRNSALVLYDWMTNTRYGMKIRAAQIDTASWTAAANYCDTKGWGIDLVVRRQEPKVDVLQTILSSFRGHLNWYDNKFYLRYADVNYETVAMNLYDRHIIADASGRSSLVVSQPGKYSVPDGLRVLWTDPDREYVEDYFYVGEESGVIEDLDLSFLTDKAHAAELGAYALERAKLDKVISGTFVDECQKLEPHDLVYFTSAVYGLTSQLMRVGSASIAGDGLVSMDLKYEALALYNAVVDQAVEGVYACTLFDRNAEPPGVTNVALTEEVYDYRGRSFTRVKVSFDVPADFANQFDHVEVRLSYDDSTWVHLFDAKDDFEINGVEEGAEYWIRLKTVSIWQTRQEDANDHKANWRIAGLTAIPASLSALVVVVNQGSVALNAVGVSSSDIAYYELRLGASWSGAVFIQRQIYPNFVLSGVKPGNHTFIANTMSNNGEYGDTPQSATAEALQDPPDGWTLLDSDTCNYSTGTHSNTERITSGDYTDYLKCSHTGGVLTGTYTSPEYDLGSSQRVMAYVMAAIAVTGVGTAWDDKLPAGALWSSVGADTQTWSQIFSLPLSPQIEITIKYGTVSGSLDGEISHAEIYSGIVTARYFQVEIIITDPSAGVNVLVEDFTLKYNTYS